MAFIPVIDVARVEMIYTQGTNRMENVFHVKSASGWDGLSLLALAATFKGWFDEELKPYLPNVYSLAMIVCTDLSSDSAPAIEYTFGLPVAGSNVASASPNNVTFAVRWITQLRGRSYRGRTYHIGMNEGATDGDQVGSETINIFTAAYNELITTVAGAGYGLVVVSRQQNGVPLNIGVATPITAASIEGTVDSQRRRLAGRGS